MGVCETNNVLELATWVWHPGEELPRRQGLGGILKYSGTKAKGGGEGSHRNKGGKAKNKTEVEPK